MQNLKGKIVEPVFDAEAMESATMRLLLRNRQAQEARDGRRRRAFYQMFNKDDEGRCRVDLLFGIKGLWRDVRARNQTEMSALQGFTRRGYWLEKERLRAAGKFDMKPEETLWLKQ